MNFTSFCRNLQYSLNFWTEQKAEETLHVEMNKLSIVSHFNKATFSKDLLISNLRCKFIQILFLENGTLNFASVMNKSPLEIFGLLNQKCRALIFLNPVCELKNEDCFDVKAFNFEAAHKEMDLFEQTYFSLNFVLTGWLIFVLNQILTKSVKELSDYSFGLKRNRYCKIIDYSRKMVTMDESELAILNWNLDETTKSEATNSILDFLGTPLKAVLINLAQIRFLFEENTAHFRNIYSFTKEKVKKVISSYLEFQSWLKSSETLLSGEIVEMMYYFSMMIQLNSSYLDVNLNKIIIFFAETIDILFDKIEISFWQGLFKNDIYFALFDVLKCFQSFSKNQEYNFSLNFIFFAFFNFRLNSFLGIDYRRKNQKESSKIRFFYKYCLNFAELGNRFDNAMRNLKQSIEF